MTACIWGSGIRRGGLALAFAVLAALGPAATSGSQIIPVPAPLGPDGRAVGAPARPAIPDGLGVNIHFTDAKPGEMEMLAAAGFRTVRMDFTWSRVERERGKYDFSAFDRLVASLEKHGIRPMLILDYSSPHYDNNLSPKSVEGRAAFAKWTAAAAKHFRARGVWWEMYNEPNIGFWKPAPNTPDYIALALETGKAIRAAAPGEAYIGPATSTIPMPFLEECFRAGLLKMWTMVTVHPYRGGPPETAASDYAALRALIGKYAPAGRRVEIGSGEWGYTAAVVSPETQGKYLARMYLANLASGVPLTIWYDWRDDGTNPKEVEHNFGTVRHDYLGGKTPPYESKPAYMAARTVSQVLKGYRVEGRLRTGNDADWVLVLRKGRDTAYAAWTTESTTRTVAIPSRTGGYAATGHTGESFGMVKAHHGTVSLPLTDAPRYLVPAKRR